MINLESVGDGRSEGQPCAVEVYSIYSDPTSAHADRWRQRLHDLEDAQPSDFVCIVLASSYVRGWGQHQDLEGILIVCREAALTKAQ